MAAKSGTVDQPVSVVAVSSSPISLVKKREISAVGLDTLYVNSNPVKKVIVKSFNIANTGADDVGLIFKIGSTFVFGGLITLGAGRTIQNDDCYYVLDPGEGIQAQIAGSQGNVFFMASGELSNS